jgi:hypothetical protein
MKYEEEPVVVKRNKELTLYNEEVDAIYKLIGKSSTAELLGKGFEKHQIKLLEEIYSAVFSYKR